VAFHHNAADRGQAVCRLIAEQVAAGESVRVHVSDDQAAEAIDRALWTFNALSFVPHCKAGDALAERTPVVIGGGGPGAARVLVNYSNELPPEAGRYAIVIEVVGQDGSEREAARARYRWYREQGFGLSTHDLNEVNANG